MAVDLCVVDEDTTHLNENQLKDASANFIGVVM